jgi:hypothetical protein
MLTAQAYVVGGIKSGRHRSHLRALSIKYVCMYHCVEGGGRAKQCVYIPPRKLMLLMMIMNTEEEKQKSKKSSLAAARTGLYPWSCIKERYPGMENIIIE